jgi:hypothetical protein
MLTLTHHGVHAIVHAYLSSDTHLALLSIAGPQEAVRASLAAALTGRELTLYERVDEIATGDDNGQSGEDWTWHSRHFIDSNIRYHALVKKLPSGQLHGLLFPASATAHSVGPTFTLLLPLSDTARAASHFFRLLDVRTPLPLHPSWADWLWQLFVHECWITDLTGEGPWTGWEVQWEPETLQDHITSAIATGHLALSS